jgi:hypothetical protein
LVAIDGALWSVHLWRGVYGLVAAGSYLGQILIMIGVVGLF